MKKDTVIDALATLGDEFDTEELVQKLIFMEKVEKGMNDVREGKSLTLEEAKEKFHSKWNK